MNDPMGDCRERRERSALIENRIELLVRISHLMFDLNPVCIDTIEYARSYGTRAHIKCEDFHAQRQFRISGMSSP